MRPGPPQSFPCQWHRRSPACSPPPRQRIPNRRVPFRPGREACRTGLAEIEKIVIADTDQLADSWFKEDILASLGDVTIEWVDPSTNDDQSGIVAVHLVTPGGVVVLD